MRSRLTKVVSDDREPGNVWVFLPDRRVPIGEPRVFKKACGFEIQKSTQWTSDHVYRRLRCACLRCALDLPFERGDSRSILARKADPELTCYELSAKICAWCARDRHY